MENLRYFTVPPPVRCDRGGPQSSTGGKERCWEKEGCSGGI